MRCIHEPAVRSHRALALGRGESAEKNVLRAPPHLSIGGCHSELDRRAAMRVTSSEVGAAQRELHRRIQVPTDHSQHDWCVPLPISLVPVGALRDEVTGNHRLAARRGDAERVRLQFGRGRWLALTSERWRHGHGAPQITSHRACCSRSVGPRLCSLCSCIATAVRSPLNKRC